MSGSFKIIYFGNDHGYWGEIQKRFESQYSGLSPEFDSFHEETPEGIQALFKKVMDLEAKIVFIDFTKHEKEYLHLARIINRTTFQNRVVCVGLAGSDNFNEHSANIFLAGVQCCHIKCGEYHDVIYDSLMMYNPKMAQEHGFCQAALSDAVPSQELIRINYVFQDHLHIETYRKLQVGDKIEVECFLEKTRGFGSKTMTVTQVGDENLFYHFEENATLKFSYFNNPKKEDFVDHDTFLQKSKAAEKNIEQAQLEIATWITENKEKNQPKRLRCLMIDKDLSIYESDKRTDEYPYVIRCKPFIDSVTKNLKALKPHLIIFNLDEADQGVAVNQVEIEKNPEIFFPNNLNTIKVICDNASHIDKFEPYIVAFNAKFQSEVLQEKLGYEKIMAIPNELDMEVIPKIFGMMAEKLKEHASSLYPEKSIVLNKNDSKSIAKIHSEIRLVQCSESDMMVGSHSEIKPFSVLYCDSPLNFYITVLPWEDGKPPGQSKSGEKFVYKALIHGISEDNKMKLRQFVNSIFFRELEEAKKLDKAEIERMKKEFVARKEAAEQAIEDKEGETDENDSSSKKAS